MTSSTNFPGPVKVQGRDVATFLRNEDGSIRALVDSAGNNSVMSSPVTTPVGFRGTTLATALDLRRTFGGVVTNFDITSLKNTPSTVYYVDPVNGSDGAAGTSAGTALKSLSTALGKASVDEVQIINLTSDFIAVGSAGWNGTTPNRSVNVVNDTGYRFISVQGIGAQTWSAYSGNAYQCTIALSADAAGVVDLSSSNYATYTDANGVLQTLSNLPKRYRTLVKVASAAAVVATPGTWYYTGTTLYVQAHDSRSLIGDVNMHPVKNNARNGGHRPTSNSLTTYISNIDFVGGATAFLSDPASTVTGSILAFDRCSFQGSTANGQSITSFATGYSYRCLAADNYTDGFSYHSKESDGTTPSTSPSWAEIECAAVGNGMTGSAGTSDNASTSHDFCNTIRLRCQYINSDDRTVADSNSAHAWNIGCHVGQAVQTSSGKESIASIGTASKVWIDSCYAAAGSNPRWIAVSGAMLKHFNSGAVVNAGTGEATGTVSAYYG